MLEQILTDLHTADESWNIILLRYFNPIGAHPTGKMGEDPNGIPNNLMPIIMRVAEGRIAKLQVYGTDYPTEDGTCRRDYIHVVDLAKGHVAALEHMKAGVNIYNLGTGKATSVKEMIAAFEQASGRELPYEFAPRRAGDLAEIWANPTKAEQELGWHAELTIADAMKDTINYLNKVKETN
jgi:UDP-glucose 4-epimerase